MQTFTVFPRNVTFCFSFLERTKTRSGSELLVLFQRVHSSCCSAGRLSSVASEFLCSLEDNYNPAEFKSFVSTIIVIVLGFVRTPVICVGKNKVPVGQHQQCVLSLAVFRFMVQKADWEGSLVVSTLPSVYRLISDWSLYFI